MVNGYNAPMLLMGFAHVQKMNKTSPYGCIKLGYPLQNTCIWPLKWQQSREMVAPSVVCECIVPNVSCWNRWAEILFGVGLQTCTAVARSALR